MADEIDLNLLRVFDAVMEAGTVTGAAERLHLSVAATSRALGRLRQAMGDPILVRAGRGLVPTSFAQRAAPRVRQVLLDASQLRQDTTGGPATWQRAFVIRINDGLIPVLAPKLTQVVSEQAPGVRLRFLAQDSKEPDVLRDGSLDLDVEVAGPPPPDVLTSPLLTDHFVAVVAADSDLGRTSVLSPDDLAAHPHVSASRRGLTRGPLDAALEGVGRTRHVVAVVPNYIVGALMVVGTDLICMLPSVMANHLASHGVPIRVHEVPFALPRSTVEQRWHQRTDTDRASRWLRSTLEDVVRDTPRTAHSHGR